MNNGDKILNRIKSDCDESIRKIETEAQESCEKILNEAKIQADKISAEIQENAKDKIAQIHASSKSRAELEIRNLLLQKRRSEIDKTVDKVLDYLINLDSKKYFDVIYALASKLKGKQGEILLNGKDIKRLPDDFEQKLKNSGINATVSKTPVDICGGFILRCGDIEENMEFTAIIAANRDRTDDLINRELFAE